MEREGGEEGGREGGILLFLILFLSFRFYLTTGDFPFQGDQIDQLYEAILAGVLDFPDDLSPQLQDLVRGMLRRDADVRFSIQEIQSHP